MVAADEGVAVVAAGDAAANRQVHAAYNIESSICGRVSVRPSCERPTSAAPNYSLELRSQLCCTCRIVVGNATLNQIQQPLRVCVILVRVVQCMLQDE